MRLLQPLQRAAGGVQGCGINEAISTLKGKTLLKRYVRLAEAEESPGQDFEAMLATILEEEGFSAEGQEEALS